MNRLHKRRIQQRNKLNSMHDCKYEQETKRLYMYRAIEKLNNRMNNHETSISWIKSVWFPLSTAILVSLIFHSLTT